ncbi:MAG: hypothetical protein WD400_01830 [Pontimonas sp.]
MPRRHRRDRDQDAEALNIERLRTGIRRVETKRGSRYVVQPISEKNALKDYRCPGCGQIIPPGQAHLVAWEDESLLGSNRALEERRHWHSHCWRIA